MNWKRHQTKSLFCNLKFLHSCVYGNSIESNMTIWQQTCLTGNLKKGIFTFYILNIQIKSNKPNFKALVWTFVQSWHFWLILKKAGRRKIFWGKGLLNFAIKRKIWIFNCKLRQWHVRHAASDQKNWNKLLQSSGRNLFRFRWWTAIWRAQRLIPCSPLFPFLRKKFNNNNDLMMTIKWWTRKGLSIHTFWHQNSQQDFVNEQNFSPSFTFQLLSLECTIEN